MKRSQNRYFRLAYSNHSPTRQDRRAALHQVRDGMANNELGAALCRHGYEFGTTIHLLPHEQRPLSDLPPLKRNDLLILTTRPPINDEERAPFSAEAGGQPSPNRLDKHRRSVPKHTGAVERLYMDALRPYFAFCDRAVVRLGETAAGLLPPNLAMYKELHFIQYSVDFVKQFQVGARRVPVGNSEAFTVAFLIRIPELQPLPCGMIISFGMSGLSTLVWNRVLRIRHPDWIMTRRFVMAKLIYKFRPGSAEPMTPEFADDERILRVELLAEETLPDRSAEKHLPGPPSERRHRQREITGIGHG